MNTFRKMLRVGSLAVILGCGSEPTVVEPVGPSADLARFKFSDWSPPERLDVSSVAADITPAISTDGLALYFASNRTGSIGSNDIWVSRRAGASDPWGVPENLGAPINSVVVDVGPSLALDGQTLYFGSSRPSSADEIGACGGASTPLAHCDNDIWQSQRECDAAGCRWGTPANLGPGVNTALFEGGQATWGHYIYFNRGGTANLLVGAPDPGPPGDIYASRFELGVSPGSGISPAFGVAEAVTELNSAAVDQRPAFRIDGREMFFTSSRAGTPDIWMSRRRTILEPWGVPERVAALSTDAQDLHPSLSADGMTMYLASNRSGNLDLYISRRTRIK
jgi:hypothetical protein